MPDFSSIFVPKESRVFCSISLITVCFLLPQQHFAIELPFFSSSYFLPKIKEKLVSLRNSHLLADARSSSPRAPPWHRHCDFVEGRNADCGYYSLCY